MGNIKVFQCTLINRIVYDTLKIIIIIKKYESVSSKYKAIINLFPFSYENLL